MTYEVRFTRSAAKERKKLPAEIQKRIDVAILELSRDPRKGDVRPMIGISSWRLRVGNYRVIYDIKNREITIIILRIRHRKDAYKS